jgi:hypothetical protein
MRNASHFAILDDGYLTGLDALAAKQQEHVQEAICGARTVASSCKLLSSAAVNSYEIDLHFAMR